MKYYVFEIQGKQFKAETGQNIVVDRVGQPDGEVIEINKVILEVDGEKIRVGKPYLNDSVLYGTIQSHQKGNKIRVSTYKAKSRYRRTIGHRQHLTTLTISDQKPKTLKAK